MYFTMYMGIVLKIDIHWLMPYVVLSVFNNGEGCSDISRYVRSTVSDVQAVEPSYDHWNVPGGIVASKPLKSIQLVGERFAGTSKQFVRG